MAITEDLSLRGARQPSSSQETGAHEDTPSDPAPVIVSYPATIRSGSRCRSSIGEDHDSGQCRAYYPRQGNAQPARWADASRSGGINASPGSGQIGAIGLRQYGEKVSAGGGANTPSTEQVQEPAPDQEKITAYDKLRSLEELMLPDRGHSWRRASPASGHWSTTP